MSDFPTPEHSAAAPSPAVSAAKRVLACTLCQQRKVKCDRKFPCANCVKSKSQCIPATLPRPRRKRFPERDLLSRLRNYEDLLRSNNISFEPMHDGSASRTYVKVDTTNSPAVAISPSSTAGKSSASGPSDFQAKNFWHAVHRRNLYDNSSSDEADSTNLLRHTEVKNAWDELYRNNDHLLFCARNSSVDLSVMHPSPTHIFKLWQVYLDNVNSLLKISHAPTLQPRIVEAASEPGKTGSAEFEALMFAIYCVAVFSMGEEEVYQMFGSAKLDVLRGYQLGAREALLACGFLRSSERDCLTALHLYLISVKSDADPRSTSSLIASAFKTAQRMGIHSEASNSKFPILEAELRRRLWWSLVHFDVRISEMTDIKSTMLVPTWDCAAPLNVNDFDLRAEMKRAPVVAAQSSEALFAVVRCEHAEFLRQSAFHLDFVNPVLKQLVSKDGVCVDLVSDEQALNALETMFEERYFSVCDPEIPLHYMVMWSARGLIARSRFVHNLAVATQGPKHTTEAHRHTGIRHALNMLDCDTKLMTSELTKPFQWHIYIHFPFPAYVHLVRYLKVRPCGEYAERAWRAMSENAAARFIETENKDNPMEKDNNPIFRLFAGLVLQAWAAREAIAKPGTPLEEPMIVIQVKKRLSGMDLQQSGDEMFGQMDQSSGHDFMSLDPMQLGNGPSWFGMSGAGLYSPGMDASAAPSEFLQRYSESQSSWPMAMWQ